MITDPLPRQVKKRDAHLHSDRLITLPLPPGESLQAATEALIQVMAGGQLRPVRAACADLLAILARFYEVGTPDVRVLGVRPHVVTHGVCTYQLFGDYTPATQRIRVWMKTAIREKVSSPKALLNTLLHEFCHHLDATRFAWPDNGQQKNLTSLAGDGRFRGATPCGRVRDPLILEYGFRAFEKLSDATRPISVSQYRRKIRPRLLGSRSFRVATPGAIPRSRWHRLAPYPTL